MAGNRNRISGRDHFRKDDMKILSILSLDYLTLNIRQIVRFFFFFFSVFEQTFFNRKSCPKERNPRFVTFNKNVRRPQFGGQKHGKDYRYLFSYSRNLFARYSDHQKWRAIYFNLSPFWFLKCAYSLFYFVNCCVKFYPNLKFIVINKILIIICIIIKNREICIIFNIEIVVNNFDV